MLCPTTIQGHQVIKVIRDEIITASYKFKALYGWHTFHRDLHAYKDEEMREEARRQTEIQDARIQAEQIEAIRLKTIAEEEEKERLHNAWDPVASNEPSERDDDSVVPPTDDLLVGSDPAHDGEQKSIGAADTCDFEKEDLASEPDSIDMISLSTVMS